MKLGDLLGVTILVGSRFILYKQERKKKKTKKKHKVAN